jgi:hypothetical protein
VTIALISPKISRRFKQTPKLPVADADQKTGISEKVGG